MTLLGEARGGTSSALHELEFPKHIHGKPGGLKVLNLADIAVSLFDTTCPRKQISDQLTARNGRLIYHQQEQYGKRALGWYIKRVH